jgi:hypothetical protein
VKFGSKSALESLKIVHYDFRIIGDKLRVDDKRSSEQKFELVAIFYEEIRILQLSALKQNPFPSAVTSSGV